MFTVVLILVFSQTPTIFLAYNTKKNPQEPPLWHSFCNPLRNLEDMKPWKYFLVLCKPLFLGRHLKISFIYVLTCVTKPYDFWRTKLNTFIPLALFPLMKTTFPWLVLHAKGRVHLTVSKNHFEALYIGNVI